MYKNSKTNSYRYLKQYSCFVYNKDNISSEPDDNVQFIISDQLFLDTLLLEIRGKTISYSTYIFKKALEREEMLKKEILNLK